MGIQVWCNLSSWFLSWNLAIFRLVLLGISIFCAVGSLVIIFLVFKYRKVKVLKVSSPTFLGLTLIGCVVMYSEVWTNHLLPLLDLYNFQQMFVLYPVLNTFLCVLSKWTRHFGFCITYFSLLMKTWRVSLTYRVKSAQQLDLSDNQLLQWMVPILLITVVYSATWSVEIITAGITLKTSLILRTVSNPPRVVDVFLPSHMKFAQCDHNWWDVSIAIGMDICNIQPKNTSSLMINLATSARDYTSWITWICHCCRNQS